MKRLIKKSDLDYKNIVNDITTNNGKVKSYIVDEANDFANTEFDNDHDLEVSECVDNFREYLIKNIDDKIEMIDDEVVTTIEKYTENVDELINNSDFKTTLAEELFEVFYNDIENEISGCWEDLMESLR